MAQSISPAELRADVEEIIDDTIDVDVFYRLMTRLRDRFESEIKPVFLIKQDATQTANPGDTYTTKKTIPTDFREMVKVWVGTVEYDSVPFASIIAFRQTARKFYIDYNAWIQGNAALGLTGAVASAQTITQVYLMKSAEITQGTEDTVSLILWPDHWKDALVYKMCKVIRGNIDPDEISFRASSEDTDEYKEIMSQIEFENGELANAANGGVIGYADEEGDIDVGTL